MVTIIQAIYLINLNLQERLFLRLLVVVCLDVNREKERSSCRLVDLVRRFIFNIEKGSYEPDILECWNKARKLGLVFVLLVGNKIDRDTLSRRRRNLRQLYPLDFPMLSRELTANSWAVVGGLAQLPLE